jgi:hypothetical protein
MGLGRGRDGLLVTHHKVSRVGQIDSIEGDRSFIIFVSNFFFAVGQIAPLEVQNSQLWLCSRKGK